MTDTTVDAPVDRRGRTTRTILVLLILILLLMLCGIAYVLFSMNRTPEKTRLVSQEPGLTVAFEAFQTNIGYLDRPVGVAYDGDDRIYVSEPTKDTILVFDKAGKNGRLFVRDTVSAKDPRPAKQRNILYPVGMDVAEDGSLYVADPEKNAVVVFNTDGKKIKEIPFERPLSVTISRNRLYVTTYGTIEVTDMAGNPLGKWGKRGQGIDELSDPAAVAVGENQRMYITDQNNYRLVALSPDFKRLWELGAAALTDAQANARKLGAPAGVTIGGDGNIYMVDGLSSNIRIINPNTGKEISAPLGKHGSNDDQFYLPKYIDSMGGDLFVVADTFHNRIVGVHLVPQPIQ